MIECAWEPPCKHADAAVCWAIRYPGFFYTDEMLLQGPVRCPCSCHDDAEESETPLPEIAA